MRRLMATILTVGIAFTPATAVARSLDPGTELNRATVKAYQTCITHFRNPAETVFIGCQDGIAEYRGPATTRKVPMRQSAGGINIATMCGPAPCIKSQGWYAQRRYTVFIDSKDRRRISRGVWRCYPGGTLPPFNWPGLRCFVNEPR